MASSLWPPDLKSANSTKVSGNRRDSRPLPRVPPVVCRRVVWPGGGGCVSKLGGQVRSLVGGGGLV